MRDLLLMVTFWFIVLSLCALTTIAWNACSNSGACPIRPVPCWPELQTCIKDPPDSASTYILLDRECVEMMLHAR